MLVFNCVHRCIPARDLDFVNLTLLSCQASVDTAKVIYLNHLVCSVKNHLSILCGKNVYWTFVEVWNLLVDISV